ncbi:hypothetical protein BV25DRAFT_15598 [Artomyces pyxidatus]|uniref:Uncharacterized protein n=1 Tax=Artomyces pyxidatus TaxID=48021 RepID=A0ACB8TJG6_9AGAM|nr:hypothetical protein BV25DRAFT_15598 [Artomyces pyxidatus]
MRRIVSVFAPRRSDKSDTLPATPDDQHILAKSSLMPSQPSKKSPRLFGSVSRITVSTAHPMPPLEQGHSSSSSSTGSASLRTPDDDRASPLGIPTRSPSGKKAWIPWMAGKKPQFVDSPTIDHPQFWSATPQMTQPSSRPHIVLNDEAESEEDTSESEESESEGGRTPAPQSSRGRTLAPLEFIQALTSNNLPPAFSPPPLLHLPNTLLFPRSSNASRSLPHVDTLESEMHKKRILRRLQRQPLSPSDQRFLASFGPRVTSAAARRTLPQPDEAARLDLKYVEPHSRGLKTWIARPYFEEQMAVWAPDEATGNILRSPVKGSGFGVWALDVSAGLEALAGVDDVEVYAPHHLSDGSQASETYASPVPEAWEPPSSASSSSSLSGPPPATAKQMPYKALPSPLRNGYDSSPDLLPVASSSRTVSPSAIPLASSVPRRGVRFAENVEKEDHVPLGYVQRHQKQRERRAKLALQEQERRRHEEERMKHEAERRQWEQERAQWQKEKQAMEETRRQKLYAEELAAARLRRDTQHGSASYGATGSAVRETDRRRDAYARPAYDSRKQSDYHPDQLQPPRPTRDASSSSSRGGSLPRSESASPRTSSRPPSTFSMHSHSSTEDALGRVPRSGSRRGSMMSESSQRSNYPAYPYAWPPVPPVPVVMPMFPSIPSMPMVPMMPQYAMDMPLLPPTPPFMLQQQRSRNSSPSSRSRPSLPNHSSERLPQSRSSPAREYFHERQRSSSDNDRGRALLPQSSSSSRMNGPRTSLPVPQSNSLDSAGLSSSTSQNRPYASRRRTAFS